MSTLDHTSIRDPFVCVGVSADPGGVCSSSSFTTYTAANWSSLCVDVNSLGIHNGSCPTCIAVAEPATNASALTFSNVQCNEMTVGLTKGNGGRRLIVMSAGAITAPTDGTFYNADKFFGNGSNVGGGTYVIYNGKAGSSVTVYNLTQNTTYNIAVYEYDGFGTCMNYRTTALSGSQATPNCSGCAAMSSLVINSCNISCSEGLQEVLFFDGAASSTAVNTANINLYYGSSLPLISAANDFTDIGFVSNAATVANMNANTGGCGSTVFFDGVTAGSIPAGADFMVVPNGFCQGDYNFSTFCGNGPVYVLFVNTDPQWNAGGYFDNSGTTCDKRFLTSVIGGCQFNYSYIPNSLSNSNGDYVTFPSYTGNAATTYGNSGCGLPLVVLPLELINFSAEKSGNGVNVKWKTTGERDLSKFTIEKSEDGYSFFSLGDFQPFNTADGGDYEFFDNTTLSRIEYYRLKIIEIGNDSYYSAIVSVSAEEKNSLSIFQSGDQLIVSSGKRKISGDSRLKIFDLTGKTVYEKQVLNENESFAIPSFNLSSGIYFASVSSNQTAEPATIKIIVP